MYKNTRGFTIVELLIVVVVIAILAAITIVGYNGITNQAKISVLKNDLQTNSSSLDITKINLGEYPPDQSGATLKSSNGNTLTYTFKSATSDYCLVARNGNLVYYKTSNTPIAEGDACPVNVSLFAGSYSEQGVVNGPVATTARFNQPVYIAMTPTNIMYVVEPYQHHIRKIENGVVSVLAGSSDINTYGYTNGTGAAARFNRPQGIAVDASGNVYVADSLNNRIRRITPAGVVSLYAGTGVAGATNGAALTVAQFNGPQALAFDSAGNLYVAEGAGRKVRKITPGGTVSTLAGTGTSGFVNGAGASAQFAYPNGIVVAPDGVVYVADRSNNAIRAISTSNVVSTFAGGSYGQDNGQGTAAQFYNVDDIVMDASGNFYVSDSGNRWIRKITPGGLVSTYAGSTVGLVDGSGTTVQFHSPTGMAISSSGTIYVVDSANSIRRIE